MNINNNKWLYTLLILSITTAFACRKEIAQKDYLSPNASFNKLDVYQPVLGRNTYQANEFNADASTYPMTFSIINAFHADGTAAPELFEKQKVQVWIRDYTGKESTLDSINAKRAWIEKPFLDIVSGSGDFMFWNTNSSKILTYPDSGYIFDVKINNIGNEQILKGFKLQPVKEQPYSPWEYDTYTGLRKNETRKRTDGSSYNVPYVNHPTFMSNLYINKDTLMVDSLVSVYIYKTGSQKNTLTFRFLDAELKPLDPGKFVPFNYNKLNDSIWTKLIHGFNMVKTSSSVTYDVAYPIPLTGITTDYATGDKARSGFRYSRRGNGSARINAEFGLDYSIYEPGEWNITFYFRRNPMFEDN